MCDVRGPAVLAYCEVVAGRGERATAAAADALGSFRAGVVATGDLETLNPEALLISATRHAAARYASSDAPEACARVPGLLAARADRSISLADHDWLDEHLQSCWTCRAPVARFKVADKAYSEPPATPLPAAVKAAMVAAMTAAAPIRRATADIPAIAANGAAAGYAEPTVPSVNGSSAHAQPVEEPYTAYDLPALDPYAPVDQPTSAFELPAGDGEPSELSADARRERRRRTRTRGGKLGAAMASGKSLPRPRRQLSHDASTRRSSLRPAVVLPVALVVIAIFVALAIAGVFGGGEPASLPQSYAPVTNDEPTKTQVAPVVVVPGAAAAAAAVEKAKAKARAEKIRKQKAAAAAKDTPDTSATDAAAATPPPPPPPAAGATPPPPPPPASNANGNSGGKPKIDAGNGATGAEQLPPAKDTSTVPELAPPVEPVPPG